MIQYKFCPQCKARIDNSGLHPKCPVCKIFFYKNSKPTVGGLPVKDGQVLLAIRGEEPHIGSLDIIGGFLEWGEHPEDGLHREFLEETGVEIEIIKLIGIYMDIYPSTGDALQNTHYIVKLKSEDFQAMDDIADIKWIDIKDSKKEERNMKFKNTREAMRDLRKWYIENEK